MFRVGYILIDDGVIPVRESSYWVQSSIELTGKRILLVYRFTRDQFRQFFITLPRAFVKWTGTSSYLLQGEDDIRFLDKDYLHSMSEHERMTVLNNLKDQSQQYCASSSPFSQIACIRSVVKACNVHETAMMKVNSGYKQRLSKLVDALTVSEIGDCDTYAPVVININKTGFYSGHSNQEYKENLVYCQDKSLVKNTCTINPLWPFLSISKQIIDEKEPVRILFSNAIDAKRTDCKSIYSYTKDTITHINSFDYLHDVMIYAQHQNIAGNFYTSPVLKGYARATAQKIEKLINKDDGVLEVVWSRSAKSEIVPFISENTRRSDYCYGLGTISRPVASIASLSTAPAAVSDIVDRVEREVIDAGFVSSALVSTVIFVTIPLVFGCMISLYQMGGRLSSSLSQRMIRPRRLNRSSSDLSEELASSSDIISDPVVVSDPRGLAVFLRDGPNRDRDGSVSSSDEGSDELPSTQLSVMDADDVQHHSGATASSARR